MAEATLARLPALYLRHFERNVATLKRNLDGISDEQALIPITEGGSHLNWMLGHIIASRNGLLRLLGAEPLWDEAARKQYGFGSSPDSADTARPLTELMHALEATQQRLQEALSQLDEARLDDEIDNGRTVGGMLDFLCWHDSYHTGQSALYRRLAGLASAIG